MSEVFTDVQPLLINQDKKTQLNGFFLVEVVTGPNGEQCFYDDNGWHYYRDAVNEYGYPVLDRDGFIAQDKEYLSIQQ